MPRNGSGTYTLPTGNPVSPGTTIESAWANTTLSDIGTELTNSLSRTGAGGMLAAFRLADGTLAAPGVAFLNETGTGFYRAGSGEMWNAVQGIQIQQYTVNGVLIPTGKTFTAQGDSTFSGALSYTSTLTGGTGIVNLGSGQFYKSATGDVGIGTNSPGYKLTVSGTSPTIVANDTGANTTRAYVSATNAQVSYGATYSGSAVPIVFGVGLASGVPANEWMRLDASGNLGLGVVPSAWRTGAKALQVGGFASLNTQQNGSVTLAFGAYESGSNTFSYLTTGDSPTAYSQITGAHKWYTAPSGTAGAAISFTQAMTLDASGNLLVGVSSQQFPSTNRRTIEVNGTAQSLLGLLVNSTSAGYFLHDGTDMSLYQTRAGAMVFGTNNTERARIDSSGNLLVGTTSTTPSSNNGVIVNVGAGNTAFMHTTGTVTGTLYQGFYLGGTAIGTITQSGTTAVLYNTTSDQRLKTHIVDAPDASALIDSIKVRSFDWISDDSHQRYGMVAQELFEVAPEAVHAPVDPDEMMAVDYSKLVPMLVKEIQSLRARVAALEA